MKIDEIKKLITDITTITQTDLENTEIKLQDNQLTVNGIGSFTITHPENITYIFIGWKWTTIKITDDIIIRIYR